MLLSQLLLQAFQVFDEDSNGKIDAGELYRVLTNLCGTDRSQQPTMEECCRMIRSVDSDGDGFVDFEEFERMMRLQLPVA